MGRGEGIDPGRVLFGDPLPGRRLGPDEPVDAPEVSATCWTDDRAYRITFDCRAFLASLSDQDLIRLAGVDWGNDYAVDEAFWFYLEGNEELQQMQAYLESKQGGEDAVGFDVQIDSAQARDWLMTQRPAVFATLGRSAD